MGLEASDGLLIFGVVNAGIGVLFLVSGITDSHVGWRFGLGFSLIGFVPAALFFRLGTGVKYWLTPEGVAKRARLQPSVYWDDVERIVPVNRGIPVAASDYMDALELEVRDPKQAQRRRRLATDFTIKLSLVESSATTSYTCSANGCLPLTTTGDHMIDRPTRRHCADIGSSGRRPAPIGGGASLSPWAILRL